MIVAAATSSINYIFLVDEGRKGPASTLLPISEERRMIAKYLGLLIRRCTISTMAENGVSVEDQSLSLRQIIDSSSALFRAAMVDGCVDPFQSSIARGIETCRAGSV